MTHVEAAFEITGWDEEDVFTGDDVRIYRVQVAKRLSGAISGTASGWMTMVVAPGDSAAYVGFDRLEVEIDGRAGSFVVRHDAAMFPGGGDARWDVVPGSGTGGLTGIGGTVTISQDADGTHTLGLEYEIDPRSPDEIAATDAPAG